MCNPSRASGTSSPQPVHAAKPLLLQALDQDFPTLASSTAKQPAKANKNRLQNSKLKKPEAAASSQHVEANEEKRAEEEKRTKEIEKRRKEMEDERAEEEKWTKESEEKLAKGREEKRAKEKEDEELSGETIVNPRRPQWSELMDDDGEEQIAQTCTEEEMAIVAPLVETTKLETQSASTIASGSCKSSKAKSARSQNLKERRRDAVQNDEGMEHHPMANSLDPAMLSRMPLPLRALASRLRSSTGNSTWSGFLPKDLQQFMYSGYQQQAEGLEASWSSEAWSAEVDSSSFQAPEAWPSELDSSSYHSDCRGDDAPQVCEDAEDVQALAASSYSGSGELYCSAMQGDAYQQPVAWMSFDEGVTFQQVVLAEFPQQCWSVNEDDCVAVAVPVAMQNCSYYPVGPVQEGIQDIAYPVQSMSIDISQFRGNVWKLAQDRSSTREVQQAFEFANSEDKLELAAELEGHVWEACKCPNANHVLQKCIEVLPAQSGQFVVDEIMQRPGGVQQIAKKQYGCRIIQRLLEHCHPEQVYAMVETLLADAVLLSTHQFGNFVILHLLEYCGNVVAYRVFEMLLQNFRQLSAQADGRVGSVMEKALRACPENRITLAQEIVSNLAVFVTLACSQYGHKAAKEAFGLVGESAKFAASMELTSPPYTNRLRVSRYGKPLLKEAETVRYGVAY